MPRRYRPREVIRVLESLGWRYSRQRGSHIILVKRGERFNVAVPTSRREVKPGTMSNIKRQAGLSSVEFNSAADEVL